MKQLGEDMELSYVIDITYQNETTETFNVTTSNIEYIMDQYQRNRDPFTWEIIITKEA